MALRFSTRLRNYILSRGSLKQALTGGAIKIFTGSQPAAADDAETGTLLVTLTKSSGSRTLETRATGTVTLSGSGGQVDSLTVGGFALIGAVVAYDTSLTQTATNLAAAINKFQHNPGYEASAFGAVVTITAPLGSGDTFNGEAVSCSVSGGTLAATPVNIGSGVSGVDWANGLSFNDAASGALAKDSSETWSGTAVASGTAGWFRFVGVITDGGASDSGYAYVRMDGNIATSGANLNMTSTSITATAVQTLSTWNLTFPASA